jgi:hypothetical protein
MSGYPRHIIGLRHHLQAEQFRPEYDILAAVTGTSTLDRRVACSVCEAQRVIPAGSRDTGCSVCGWHGSEDVN